MPLSGKRINSAVSKEQLILLEALAVILKASTSVSIFNAVCLFGRLARSSEFYLQKQEKIGLQMTEAEPQLTNS